MSLPGLCSVLRLVFPLRAEALEGASKEVESLLKLRNVSKTRWLARSESILAVWISFKVIQNTLVDVSRLISLTSKQKRQRQSHLETYINTLCYKFDVYEERHAAYASDDRNPLLI